MTMSTRIAPPDQVARATAFRDLHRAGGLILPNAWDAISARVLGAAGFPAVATASAAIAFARGYADGEHITRDEMLAEVALVARQLTIPVSADVEAGYGPSLSDVEATVAGVIAAGAVGINLEDALPAGPPPGATGPFSALWPVEEAAARVAAARARADRDGLPLIINARTDVFLLGLGASDDERLAVATERGRAYLAAGADVVFVPGVRDEALVRRLAGAIGGPISLLAGPGTGSAAELFAAGACRISTGPHLLLSAMGHLRRVATMMRDDRSFAAFDHDHLSFGEADAFFA
ncbi:MAG TPA: isocitrate lyase/phosphoenolpyruvate mutase family protein [Thermomicrobiales bacterium]|jgi:2-methylisocitrate lyase-like PEP mutase family enzyme|nr:isocitrate lyase/phosphoenolpyruvate mutase family protein [Thermomicrobiales bacterium]